MAEIQKPGKKAKKTDETAKSRGRRIFEAAAPEAAELLIRAMSDENMKMVDRLDCAREILNRVYGKIASQGAPAPECVTVELSSELSDYAG